MNAFCLFENENIADIYYENSCLNGVKRVVNTVSEDLLLVTGKKPKIINSLEDCQNEYLIIVAAFGHSAIIDSYIEKGLLDKNDLAKKRECFIIKLFDTPFKDFPKIKQILLIAGSDKRGTIYGIFHLSEICGVSPLVFWGDVKPVTKNKLSLSFENDFFSKEPSVKYRGFFINDEWPAFGKWCSEHYCGINAKAYDKVFELVLRLKGNYLWPAMWDSSFWEDGPGIENARLADEYGVIIGTSHHEPLCRAGVEWQRQYKKYGDNNAWSYIANSEAITEFWKDGINRSKGFENIITIGMRGENDSLLLGENATIQDNIDVLKKAILTQNKLIKENVNSELKIVPRMLAIYKEVENFYFGVNNCEGLRGWNEINDVILLFSDDNYGNLRAIPELDDNPHSGGYGIYYHFDYHGAPYSYEWLNRTNLTKAWEQLTMAYEYGIREMWIVNVGDIKGNEYPLSYFMDLAYDYNKWGINNLNSAEEYSKYWIEKQFGDSLSYEQKTVIHEILVSYTKWSAARIPESLNPGVYKNNFHEIENTRDSVLITLSKTKSLREELPQHSIAAYESMIYYPVLAFFNTMLINLEAAMNHLHAERGTLITNQYAVVLKEHILLDRKYIDEFHRIINGKWNHMMDSAHMCFKNWDDNNWAYPIVKTIQPIPCPKIAVSFRGNNTYNLGHHWQEKTPICDIEMTRPDINEIILDIDSRGDIDFHFIITCDKTWLSFSQTSGESCLKEKPGTSITIYCNRDKLSNEDTSLIKISFEFVNGERKQALLNIKAGNSDYSNYHGAFLFSQNYICINAENYSEKIDVKKKGWKVIPRLGRTGSAIKSFPVTKNWEKEKNRPYAQYDFIIKETNEYIITFYLSPRNPMIKGGIIKGFYSINNDKIELFDIVQKDYYTEWFNNEWSYGVTNNIRKVNISASFQQGLNNIKFYAANPNTILENIVIFPKNLPVPETFLAPPESYRIP